MMDIVVSMFAFALGAIIGSFLNVCIYRLPAGKSIVFPASHCPSCGARIAPYDNLPLLSYLILRGKCRQCKAVISMQYPVVELVNALLTLMLFLKFGISLDFLIFMVFCSSLVVITFIDLEHQIIPDVISLPGIAVGFGASFILSDPLYPSETIGWLHSLIGIVVGGGSLLLVAWGYELLTKKEGMGGGDIKLLAMIGAFLGWVSIPFVIFFSSLLGSVVGIAVAYLQKKDGKLPIPFGPFLAFGAIFYIFYGGPIIYWWLGAGRH